LEERGRSTLRWPVLGTHTADALRVPIHDEIVLWVSEDRVVAGVAALGVRDDHGAVGGANHRYLHPVDRRGRRVALDDFERAAACAEMRKTAMAA
jgi:hypothetical protein